MKSITTKYSTPKTILTLIACTMLAGCGASTGKSPSSVDTNDQISNAIQRAAENAAMEKTPSLAAAEREYNKDSKNAANAVHYAAALREEGYANRASVVLEPFANEPKALPGVKSEYAAIQLALGNNEAAERYAQKAVLQDPQDFRAFHYLGIALDAQGKHPEAERAFRKALDHWEGDPTTVMNNLALNLASQEYLDEASEILQKAQAIAPDRVEIERNLRIVTALQQSDKRIAPKPKKKPERL